MSAFVGADGRLMQQWLKAGLAPADPVKLVEALRAALSDMRGTADLAPEAADREDDLLTVYVVPDLHLGMLAHGAECGEDYDLRIAEAMIRREVGRLMTMAPPSRHALGLMPNRRAPSA